MSTHSSGSSFTVNADLPCMSEEAQQRHPPLVPPMLRRRNTTVLNISKPPRARRLVLLAFVAVAFLQGASFATFSMVPKLAKDLFSGITEDSLAWTLNCNNVAQALFIPGAIWLLRKRKTPPGGGIVSTGLRATVVLAAAAQSLQSLLWCGATLVPHSALVVPMLFMGACAGGICTGCVQGACVRLSAVWFPPGERGRATAAAYAALFAGQSLAYVCCQLLCSVGMLKLFLYLQLAISAGLGLIMLVFFPDRPSQHLVSGRTLRPLLPASRPARRPRGPPSHPAEPSPSRRRPLLTLRRTALARTGRAERQWRAEQGGCARRARGRQADAVLHRAAAAAARVAVERTDHPVGRVGVGLLDGVAADAAAHVGRRGEGARAPPLGPPPPPLGALVLLLY